jgi:hypothetical protein
MRALVVYESMYGNTHAVAESIAEGLRPAFDVTVVPVAQATGELVSAADLLVAGGPTHMHGMSGAVSRKRAADAAVKAGSALGLDPEAGGPGLRDWLDGAGQGHKAPAAAFDTRIDLPRPLTGHASHGISRRLRGHGYRLVIRPESFLVDKEKNTLLDGEVSRARQWGAAVATAAAAQQAD